MTHSILCWIRLFCFSQLSSSFHLTHDLIIPYLYSWNRSNSINTIKIVIVCVLLTSYSKYHFSGKNGISSLNTCGKISPVSWLFWTSFSSSSSSFFFFSLCYHIPTNNKLIFDDNYFMSMEFYELSSFNSTPNNCFIPCLDKGIEAYEVNWLSWGHTGKWPGILPCLV